MKSFAEMGGIVAILNIICIISVIFVERKRPQATVSWVLVIFFLPLIGALAYLLLGTSGSFVWAYNRRINNRIQSFDDYTRLLYQQLEMNREGTINFNDQSVNRVRDLITLNLNQNGSLYSQNNDILVIKSGIEKYQMLFSDIKNAKHTINIQYFIIESDDIGKRFVELLADKAREGVEVRLIYDAYGSFLTRSSFFDPIRDSGGKVYAFFGNRLNNFIRANHRNHRKIVVIDGMIAYTGGMNIGGKYTGTDKRITPWRDTHLRITGVAVYMLQLPFLIDWEFSSGEKIIFDDDYAFEKFFAPVDIQGQIGAQVVLSGPDVGGEHIKYSYLKMINDARKSIYIQTPYFIPDEIMLQSLIIAAKSGVDVRIMMPGVPDKWYIYAITLSFIDELLKNGIRVYFYEGFLHSKTIVMDSLVTSIGTCNFDMRSFSLNLEVNVFAYGEKFGSENTQTFFDDMEKCHEVTWDKFKKRGIWERTLERLFRLIAPLG